MLPRYLSFRYSVGSHADFKKGHFKESRRVRLPFHLVFVDIVDGTASL